MMALDPFDAGKQALAAMVEHGIAPTPENYLVWYTHFSGENPALSRIIRLLEQNGDAFTPERCEELYARFFVHNDAQKFLHEATGRIERLMGALETELTRTKTESEESGHRLADICARLGRSQDQCSLRELGRLLREETARLAAHARALGQQVQSHSAEIQELKANLDRIRREAETDPLTGLGNRKAFDVKFRELATQAMEEGSPLSLFVTDIDHFKRFNDTYGHQMGDVVLKLVAHRIRQGLRREDFAARYGGEEFAVLLPGLDLRQAWQTAERIRAQIASSALRERGSGRELGRVTISAGVAEFRPGEPLRELFERADAALYAAKRSGRNRVLREDHLDESVATETATSPAPA